MYEDLNDISRALDRADSLMESRSATDFYHSTLDLMADHIKENGFPPDNVTLDIIRRLNHIDGLTSRIATAMNTVWSYLKQIEYDYDNRENNKKRPPESFFNQVIFRANREYDYMIKCLNRITTYNFLRRTDQDNLDENIYEEDASRLCEQLDHLLQLTNDVMTLAEWRNQAVRELEAVFPS